jgi:DNA-binding response OmpR family regulator
VKGFAIFAAIGEYREVFHFGEFTLDVQERRLLRGADAVRLAPKTFDLLVGFVRHSGRLVSKDELLARVWPNSFVEEGILNVHVSALRRVFGDEHGRPPTSKRWRVRVIGSPRGSDVSKTSTSTRRRSVRHPARGTV